MFLNYTYDDITWSMIQNRIAAGKCVKQKVSGMDVDTFLNTFIASGDRRNIICTSAVRQELK